ncbi:hypothetical protein V5799_012935 [Amblyomma americanum]|uniref:Gustatory receptor n=1 Tax=Amblyomma americanum TaxID=6943 RepID=A0AAQ4E7F7_AMBAM
MQFDPYQDVVATVQFSFDMLYMLVCFIIVSFSAAAVCEAHDDSLPRVNRMVAAHCATPAPDSEFLEQAFLLASQMQTRDVSLTAWKFYDLNRAALVTTGGAIATYVVVVLQMAPTFLEGSGH